MGLFQSIGNFVVNTVVKASGASDKQAAAIQTAAQPVTKAFEDNSKTAIAATLATVATVATGGAASPLLAAVAGGAAGASIASRANAAGQKTFIETQTSLGNKVNVTGQNLAKNVDQAIGITQTAVAIANQAKKPTVSQGIPGSASNPDVRPPAGPTPMPPSNVAVPPVASKPSTPAPTPAPIQSLITPTQKPMDLTSVLNLAGSVLNGVSAGQAQVTKSGGVSVPTAQQGSGLFQSLTNLASGLVTSAVKSSSTPAAQKAPVVQTPVATSVGGSSLLGSGGGVSITLGGGQPGAPVTQNTKPTPTSSGASFQISTLMEVVLLIGGAIFLLFNWKKIFR